MNLLAAALGISCEDEAIYFSFQINSGYQSARAASDADSHDVLNCGCFGSRLDLSISTTSDAEATRRHAQQWRHGRWNNGQHRG